MNHHVNSFEKGLNKDVHPSLINQSQYVDARNVVLNSLDGSSTYSLSNEEGFKIYSDFNLKRPNSIILGFCQIDDIIVIFSKSEFSSQIGYIQNNIYNIVVDDLDSIYWLNGFIDPEQRLNFDINYHINSTAKKDFNGQILVYFVDNLNYPRVININKDYTVEKFRQLSNQLRLQDNYKYPHIFLDKIVEGGQLKCGVYQFTARYLNENLDPTGFGYVTNIIPIVNENPDEDWQNYDGENFDAPPVSKSIKLNIENIDENYKYLEIAVIYFTGGDSSFQSSIFARKIIEGSSMNVTFDGLLKDEKLTVEQIADIRTIYSSAAHIIQKDNILFLANLKKKSQVDLQLIANRLELEWLYEKEALISLNTKAKPLYKFENYTYFKKGYRRGETYSFGIVAKLKTGEETFVHHIPADVRPGESINQPFSDISDAGFIIRNFSFNDSLDVQTGPLNTYISSVKYNEKDYYFDKFTGADLYGQGIRHWTIPDNEQLPFFTRSLNPFDIEPIKARPIGIVIKNLEDILDQYPSIKDQIESISLVRQQRNTFSHKSVYSQGFANDMLLQDGVIPNVFRSDDSDFESFKTTEDKEKRVSNRDKDVTDYKASLIQNPFFGKTLIVDYNAVFFINGQIRYNFISGQIGTRVYFKIGTGSNDTYFPGHPNDLIKYNGIFPQKEPVGTFVFESIDPIARSSIFFYSPETVFLEKNFQIPNGCRLKPVADLSSFVSEVFDEKRTITSADAGTSGDLPPNFKLTAYDLSRGNYSDDVKFPLSLTPRSPYFHMFGQWLNPIKFYSKFINKTNIISSYQYAQSNGEIRGPETFTNLNTIIKGKYPLNMYDTESSVVMELDKDLYKSEYEGGILASIGVTYHNNDGAETWPDDCFTNFEINNDKNKLAGANALYYLDTNTSIPSNETIAKKDSGLNAYRYLYSIESENKSQYGELDANEYILVDTFYTNTPINTRLRKIKNSLLCYNGDTFISMFSYRNSIRINYRNSYVAWSGEDYKMPYGDDPLISGEMNGGWFRLFNKNGAELRMLHYLPVESDINCAYRHRPVERDNDGNVIKSGVPYYPKNDIVACLDYESEMGNSSGYNIQYSKENEIKKFILKPFGLIDIVEFPNRIVYSLNSIEQEQSDKYKYFLPNNFQEIPKDKGQITSLFDFNNTLYCHTERSLWRTFVNDKAIVPSTTNELILGTGGVLALPPNQIYNIKGGYCGTLHDRSVLNTPFGVFFVDNLQQKIFYFNGNAPEEISEQGLFNYFQNLLKDKIENKTQINNGILSLYDPSNRRIIFKIKDETISYSLFTKTWTSFHDYTPALSYFLNNKFYITRDGVLYETDRKRMGYYINNFYDSYITYVSNGDPALSKTFDNIIVNCEFRNSDQLVKFLNFFYKLECFNEKQYSGIVDLKVVDKSQPQYNIFEYNVNYTNSQYQIKIPFSATSDNNLNIFDILNNVKYSETIYNLLNNLPDYQRIPARFKGKYLIEKLIFNNERNKDHKFTLINTINIFRRNLR